MERKLSLIDGYDRGECCGRTPKLVVLIRLIMDVTATHLYASGVQKHIQDALKTGLSRDEIMQVFKLASVVGIHSCALGVPILQAELDSLGYVVNDEASSVLTPTCDELRAQGNFNPFMGNTVSPGSCIFGRFSENGHAYLAKSDFTTIVD